MTATVAGIPVRPTRYAGLGYCHVVARGVNHWRFVDSSAGSAAGVVGDFYPTRAELLADVARFAAERGYDLEVPR